MIELYRLSGLPIYVSIAQIRWVEACPDTIVTFVDGARLVVKETPGEITDKIRAWKMGEAGGDHQWS